MIFYVCFFNRSLLNVNNRFGKVVSQNKLQSLRDPRNKPVLYFTIRGNGDFDPDLKTLAGYLNNTNGDNMGLINILNICPGVISHLNERFGVLLQNKKLEMPDFSAADSILSVSDYAGQDLKKIGAKYAKYQVLSFIILDWNNAGIWDLTRLAFRIKKLDFERNMEYKKLNKDKVRFRLLDEFLNIFDSINGIVLTYLIHNDIKYLLRSSGLIPRRLRRS